MTGLVRAVGRDRDPSGLVKAVDGETAGRDPRRVTAAEYAAAGHVAMPLSKAVRAKCLDCCAGSSTEVRKCVATGCPLWPYRLGGNPFRTRRELSPEQRARLAEQLNRVRKSRDPGN